MDASAYIKELKQKVVRLNQEIACAQDALRHKSSYPTVYFNHIAYISFIYHAEVRYRYTWKEIIMHI
jgi:hypothetical protein